LTEPARGRGGKERERGTERKEVEGETGIKRQRREREREIQREREEVERERRMKREREEVEEGGVEPVVHRPDL
jgi:RNA polymerase II elongation factor ELL